MARVWNRAFRKLNWETSPRVWSLVGRTRCPYVGAASFVSAQTSTGASVVFLASDSQLLGPSQSGTPSSPTPDPSLNASQKLVSGYTC